MQDHSYHIILLEDNPADLYIVKHSIQETGLDCEFTTFSNGADALAFVGAANSRIPDLMILDFNVPIVGGTSVLNSVRTNARWSHVGVFIFTGSRNPADAARAKSLGADRCLVKPNDLAGFADIAAIVKDWLEKDQIRSSS